MEGVSQLAMYLFWAAVCLALVHGLMAALFVRLFYRGNAAPTPDVELPRVTVLLSLRGADPSLASGLRRLLSQQYPRYSIRIVVDSRSDPAWEVVQHAIEETGADFVTVTPLRDRLETCSLKCSALVQLANGLREEEEVVVLADADLMFHDQWLRELVSPLSEAGIGAVYGNRWFWPQDGYWGSLVRYIWNAGAVIPMHFLQIPWGGSFAIRASVLRDSGLLYKWSRALVEDAPACTALQEHGLKLKFVPSLMMVSEEECDLAFSLDFVKRQLTWTKTYHPRWPSVAVYTILATGVMVLGITLPPLSALLGQWQAAAWSGAGIMIYWLTAAAVFAALEAGVRRVIRRRCTDQRIPAFSLKRQFKLMLAMPLTQIIQFLGVLLATFRRRVVWRGITYEISGPWEIRVENYRPFEQKKKSDSNLSL